MPTANPAVSVVVCSLNGAASLGATLDALASQTVPDIEVVVVDDGSTDGTRLVAEHRGVKVIVHPQNAGLAAARNTGWRHAGASLVAYTDDDCRPAPTWIEQLLRGAERHPGAAGWGGSVSSAAENSIVLRYLRRNNPLAPLAIELGGRVSLARRLSLYLRRGASQPRLAPDAPIASAVGANMMFRRHVLEQFGGFDARFRFGGEEEDLCRRIVEAGLELIYLPEAVVEHDFDADLGDTLRRSRSYGRGSARMFLKHQGNPPTVFPLPPVMASLLLLAIVRRSWLFAVLVGLSPHVLFSRWLREAWKAKDAERLLYPYVQLLQEAYGDIGFTEEYFRLRNRFPDASNPIGP